MEKVFLNNIRKEVVNVLNEANNQIDIAMAWFTSQELLDCLIGKLKSGVKVRLLILDDEINRNDSFGLDFSKFIEANGQLFLFSPSIKFMHNKYCIIDNDYVITGSYNWTNYAEVRNLENIIITDERSTIKLYKEGFQELCQNQTETKDYTRIPCELITRESYKGNYDEFEVEKSFYESVKPVVKTTEPKVVEHVNRQLPKAACNIGFHAYVNGNNDGLRVLVEKGTDLPYAITKDSWLNNDDITSIPCEIYYGDNNKTISGNKKLVTLSLDIPKKKKNELHFKTKVTLDTNGYLHIEFVCIETGKSKDTTICKDFLVEYCDK